MIGRSAALLALVLVAGTALGHDGQHPHHDSAVFPAERVVPPNTPVTDRFGVTTGFVERYAGAGPLVVSFTYASCGTVCPIANAVLAEIQADLVGMGITIVTVSIDPARDTPAAMTASAEAFGAGPSWHWLAATPAQTPEFLAAFGVPDRAPEDHVPMMLVGDLASGEFVRVVGLPDPATLADLARAVAGGGP